MNKEDLMNTLGIEENKIKIERIQKAVVVRGREMDTKETVMDEITNKRV